jgi:hypothetical protein
MTGPKKKQAEQMFARIGEAMVANAAQAATGGLGTLELLPSQGENTKELQTLLHQVVDDNRLCSLKVHRKPAIGRPVFLGFISEIPPKDLVSVGIEESIRRVFGGGEFVVDLMAEGMAKPLAKGLVFHIAGTANYLPGEAQTGQHMAGMAALAPPGAPQQAWQANPLPPAMSTTWRQVKGNGSTSTDDLMETMRQTLVLKAAASGQSDNKNNEQLEALKAQLAEMREQSRRTEEAMREERRQSEMRAYMEQSNRRFEELAKMVSERSKPETNWKEILPVIAAAAAPVISAVIGKSDASAQIMTAVLQNQNAGATNQTEMLKLFMSRPSAEERMGTMIGSIAELMNAQFGTVSQVLQSGLFDKGGDHPAVALISQALDAGREIAGNIFTGMKANADSEHEEMADEDIAGLLNTPTVLSKQSIMPPPPVQPAPELEAYEEGEESSEEELEQPEDESEEELVTESDSGADSPQSFDVSKDPALGIIIDKIRQEGWLQEIALRIWRHAGGDNHENGHPIARQWWERPVETSQAILGPLEIPQERIAAVVDAIASVKLYGRNNNLMDLALRTIPGLKKRTEKASKAEVAPPQ